MAVVIRLSRQGKRNSPIYRIVVQDKQTHPQKKFLEVLGNFYGRGQQKPDSATFQCNLERLRHWVSKGAICSDRLRQLLSVHGFQAPSTPTV